MDKLAYEYGALWALKTGADFGLTGKALARQIGTVGRTLEQATQAEKSVALRKVPTMADIMKAKQNMAQGLSGTVKTPLK